MGPPRPPTEPTRPIAAVAPPPPPSRRHGAADHRRARRLVILLAVVGFVLLSGGDNGRSDGGNRPRAAATDRDAAQEEGVDRRHADTDGREHARADRDRDRDGDGHGDGHAAAGRPGRASRRPAACSSRDTTPARPATSPPRSPLFRRAEGVRRRPQLDPCGYALYEVGAALVGLGRNDEAIPYLERRLDDYGDNSAGDVQKALDQAQGGKPGKGQDKKDKGND